MRMGLLAMLLLASVAAQAEDGAALYRRCATCHLPSGAGVPGTFPPLDAHLGALAARPDGRAYLVMTVSAGLSGALQLGDKTYRGTMPPQPFDVAGTASVLNHVLDRFSPGAAKFTDDEVAKIRAAHAGLKADGVLALRPADAR